VHPRLLELPLPLPRPPHQCLVPAVAEMAVAAKRLMVAVFSPAVECSAACSREDPRESESADQR
jgi:hypothetical protein